MLASVHKREYSPVAVLPGMYGLLSHSNSSSPHRISSTDGYMPDKQVPHC